MSALTAPVFEIQSFCIHDGPGIRSVVFLKGCPLRCLWCANPESQSARPEVFVYPEKCVGCGICTAACPTGAANLAKTDRERCTGCGACARACQAGARVLSGRDMTVAEVLRKVEGDRLFYEESGGGITLSGGEPLTHPEFCAALLDAAREAGLHTAVESCVFASREAVDAVFSRADLALTDVKHMDSAAHERLTGVPNETILDNIRHIRFELGVPVVLRMPTVPGLNDSEENVAAAADFAKSLGAPLCLLPYHRLGLGKLDALGRPRGEDIPLPDDARMESLRALAESRGIECRIGG
ncbi:MAG: glycyl-radical enzyme activating protein [Oscillospiraceae bacterium]|nr:glycyl-radical enzyme activating protein [Oscillospiraceae bacterium]